MNTLFLGGLPRILDFGFELDGILQSVTKNWQLRNSITLDSRPKSKRSQRDRLFRSFPARKWLRRVNTTAVGDKAFFVTLLALRVSRSGHFWRSCGRGRPPPLCSRLPCATAGQRVPQPQLRKRHRPSASHSRKDTKNAFSATTVVFTLRHHLGFIRLQPSMSFATKVQAVKGKCSSLLEDVPAHDTPIQLSWATPNCSPVYIPGCHLCARRICFAHHCKDKTG